MVALRIVEVGLPFKPSRGPALGSWLTGLAEAQWDVTEGRVSGMSVSSGLIPTKEQQRKGHITWNWKRILQLFEVESFLPIQDQWCCRQVRGRTCRVPTTGAYRTTFHPIEVALDNNQLTRIVLLQGILKNLRTVLIFHRV